MWIWGRRTDLAVFGGSAALALAIGGAAKVLAPGGELPVWAWLAFVLAIDVAHVWTTLFRTYLDRAELAARPGLYVGLPLGCYLVGVVLYLAGSLVFWRVLAYVAVFHFVRQQIGWVAIYRARARLAAHGRRLDHAVIYAATGFPLLYWHAHLPRAFQWFIAGDFIDHPALARALGAAVLPAALVYAALLVAYLVRAIRETRAGRPAWGKHLVVATTAAVWLFGIVLSNDDFTFTVTNVTIHGIPYMALLWAYTRARADERPESAIARVAAFGVGAFFAVALACAFTEELVWDRFIWHERPMIFGAGGMLGPWAQALLVPLFALPQAVHYALDGLLWRRQDAGPAQARALGFA